MAGAVRDDRYWDAAVETLDRERLHALQEKRLRWQVERCASGSEFYRERMASVGAEPGDIRTEKDLRCLPVTKKQELRDEQAAHQPLGRFVVAPKESWREVHPSTGTTGAPVNTIWSTRDVEG